MRSIFTTLLIALALCASAQNDCESALVVTAGSYEVDEVNGTELPPYYCVGWADGVTAAEWYVYTAPADYALTVTTNLPENPDVDTRVHVYTGTCGNLMCYDGDDDSGEDYSSVAVFNVDEGETYYIVFDNYWDSQGFPFEIIESEPIVALINFNSQPLSMSGWVMATVDMNADFLDDVVAIDGDEVVIKYQLAEGGFDMETIPTGPVTNDPSWSLAAGDLDGNGYNDLLYAGGGGVSFIWANDNGTGYSETHTDEYVFCQRSNMVDINGDGNLDAFVCHDIAPNVFYINDGDGNLTFNQGGLGDTEDGGNYGSVWIDYDNDCDMDMFIAKCRGGNSAANIDQLHRNDGNGEFTEVAADAGLASNSQSWSSAWADYDNDGDMDVIVVASSFENGGHALMLNNGDGTFTNITEDSGWDLFTGTATDNCPGDFNNDGFVDVLVGEGTFLINNGDLTFTQSLSDLYAGPVGDLNNDGFLDVVSGGTAYMNEGNENNFLTINTIGTASNKNGIGARITLFTPSGNQIRDVRSAEGFRNMSSLNAHFGLGSETTITKIQVCWPSGIMDEIVSPEINETLTIVEGSAPIGVEEVADNDSWVVYPNPAEDVLTVGLAGISNNAVYIYDLSGKLAMTTTLTNKQVNISNLPAGVYAISVDVNGERVNRSFTKK